MHSKFVVNLNIFNLLDWLRFSFKYVTFYNVEAAEVAEILAQYGIEPHEYAPVVNALRKRPQAWLDFMMK